MMLMYIRQPSRLSQISSNNLREEEEEEENLNHFALRSNQIGFHFK